MRNGIISKVEPGSCASDGGIAPGDSLYKINNQIVRDIFDYRFLTADEFVSLELIDKSGEHYFVDIEKDEDEDLGIEFENPMIDNDRSCANHCIFCFIDQMPHGMRDSLYFKDDDTRLSFLTGSYVTLTNMPDRELDRVVKYHLSPINVSVHTTNPDLRCMMLKHRGAGDVLRKIDKLISGNITVNCQVVLVPGINDGDELKRTLYDLFERAPSIGSVSVVPVGITKYREGLPKLRTFTKDECAQIVRQIKEYQDEFLAKKGTRFVFASDEIYIKAGLLLPKYDEYEEFPQLENGVGSVRLLESEVVNYINSDKNDLVKRLQNKPRVVSIATGVAAYNSICSLTQYISEISDKLTINVYQIENDFFGHDVTVAGLITGQDLIAQLKGKDLGDAVIITENMLRSGERVFLDDITLEQAEHEIGVPIIANKDSGIDFVDKIIGGIL